MKAATNSAPSLNFIRDFRSCQLSIRRAFWDTVRFCRHPGEMSGTSSHRPENWHQSNVGICAVAATNGRAPRHLRRRPSRPEHPFRHPPPHRIQRARRLPLRGGFVARQRGPFGVVMLAPCTVRWLRARAARRRLAHRAGDAADLLGRQRAEGECHAVLPR